VNEQYVNLWECMTTIGSNKNKEVSNHEKCKALQEMCGQVRSFGDELSLTVDEMGNWMVEIFHHERQGDEGVKFTVAKSGRVTATRKTYDESSGLGETRSVSF
jgi:hypothetical protein